MRITPVTGDLPAVVTGPPPVRLVHEAPVPPPPTVVARADVAGADADATSDRRRHPTPQTCFDPPLIAQRAVLGLPVGTLIADLALEKAIPHAAASAAVDLEVARQQVPQQ
jgi:hypothetical protein